LIRNGVVGTLLVEILSLWGVPVRGLLDGEFSLFVRKSSEKKLYTSGVNTISNLSKGGGAVFNCD
jgi:hypothetical protein